MVLPVLVINRAVDEDRLSQFRTSARTFGLNPTRIDALDAHRPDFPFALYGDLLRDHFWDSDQIKPGAIGCFLSHRRAWQHVVDNELTAALICEDDAEFLRDTQQLEQVTAALPDFDVVFANARMARWCAAFGDYDLKPLQQVIADLAGAGGPKAQDLKSTPGGDCYLVSKSGAEALLKRTALMGITCGVDWAMVWQGLGAADDVLCSAFPELKSISTMHQVQMPQKIFALADPVADQRKGNSVLQHAVTLPIAELTQRRSMLAHTEAISTIQLGNTTLCFACRSGPDPVMEAHRSGQIWDEPGLTALLQRFAEGGVFVDIGAHSGNHAVIMAKLGGARRVITVEPNDEIHRLLHTNMAINGVAERLDLRSGVALSSKPGIGCLIRNRKRSSETMVKTDPPEGSGVEPDKVELIDGDSLLQDEVVAAIKIDTSGSEVDVVKGLRRTLSTHQPLLLLDHGKNAQDRIKRLADEISYRIIETHPAGRKNRVSSLLIPR